MVWNLINDYVRWFCHFIIVSFLNLCYFSSFEQTPYSAGISTYWPVIITGDMNFEPYTGVYRLLTEGMFRYEGLSNRTLTDNFRGRILGKELLPRILDISDTCQHWGILCMRAIEKLDSKSQLKFLKVCSTCLT
jgi:hypothetical protein